MDSAYLPVPAFIHSVWSLPELFGTQISLLWNLLNFSRKAAPPWLRKASKKMRSFLCFKVVYWMSSIDWKNGAIFLVI